jgi:hypothetical protein
MWPGLHWLALSGLELERMMLLGPRPLVPQGGTVMERPFGPFGLPMPCASRHQNVETPDAGLKAGATSAAGLKTEGLQLFETLEAPFDARPGL